MKTLSLLAIMPHCQFCHQDMVLIPTELEQEMELELESEFELDAPMYTDFDDEHLFVCFDCSNKQMLTGIYAYTCNRCNHPLYIKKCANVLEPPVEADDSVEAELSLSYDPSTLDSLWEACKAWNSSSPSEEEIDISHLDIYMCSEDILLTDGARRFLLCPMGEESKSIPLTLSCRNSDCTEYNKEIETGLCG